MYDFYHDAGHHHRSQCKHLTAFKRQDPSLAWALHFLAISLAYLCRNYGKLYSFGLGPKFT